MTDNLRVLKEILQTNRQIKSRIESLTNEFSSLQSDFIQELKEIPQTTIDDEHEFFENFSLKLDTQFTFGNVQLAVYGPNASGKTSFLLNFLKIGPILPVACGPVSARIIKLTYASPTESCFNVYSSINAGLSQAPTITHIDLSLFFTDPTKPDWIGLRQSISSHVERPTNLSEEEFTDWVKHFIEIRLPSATLKLGIDVYDTPGFLFHENIGIKENLKDLITFIQPTLIFMYDNATIAGDAYECYLALKSTLENLEYHSIFFLNTKQDVTTIFDDAGIAITQRHSFTEKKFFEILPQERNRRLKLLLNVPAMVNDLHRDSNTNDQYDNFDICSLPKARSLLPQCATQMTESAISRIIQFTVQTDLQRPYAIVHKVLNSIDRFFQFSLILSHRDPSQWQKICSDAQAWGQTFFAKFQDRMSASIDTVHPNILRHFDQCSTNIYERAIRLDRVSDPLPNKGRAMIKQDMKQFIEIAVQEEVIKVAVNEIVNRTKDALRESITHENSIHLDENELLLAAQRQVLIDISATELEQRTWFESILLGILRMPVTISRFVKDAKKRWIVANRNTTMTLHDFQTKEEYDAYIQALDDHECLINPDKREDFAKNYLEQMKVNITQQETRFQRNLKDWIENRKRTFFENIHSNHRLALKHLSTRKIAYQKSNQYAGRFARIQCHLIAIEQRQSCYGQLPSIDTSITLGQGAFFVIHPAQWGEKTNLVVKKVKHSLVDPPDLQYLEAHYHRKITQLSIPHVVPLLYLFVNPLDENDLWIFLPRYKQTLNEYLEISIQTIQSDQILKIALDMANVICKLHSHEIVHRDLKSRNILLDEKNQCYLADFGTCKQTTVNDTIVGTYPLPPEFFSSQHEPVFNYDGMAVDIYAFGILLYELLPKSRYHRPTLSQHDLEMKDLLKKIAPFDMNNNDYERLIGQCLAKQVEQRPSALELIQKLEEIKKNSERKTCMICEMRIRICRYYPCGHKLLCKDCHNQLKRNDQNQIQCILCQHRVDRWQEDDQDQTFYLKT